MKNKLTWKIWLWLAVLSVSIIAIFGIPPKFLQEGVEITGVEQNSAAFELGLRKGQIITEIDGKKIRNQDDFSAALSGKFTSNESVKTTIQTTSGDFILFSSSHPEISVSETEKTNLETGLDLQGGSRAIIKAENKKLSLQEANDLKEILGNRLNVHGLEDVDVSAISDLSGEYFIKIEMAGATPGDLRELVSQQGKFEARIGNETVFIGGNKDITSVSRSGQESGIESCRRLEQGYSCNFRFAIYLSGEAARRHMEITDSLELDAANPGYLSAPLNLYLDDRQVESLLISQGLKGVLTNQISIQGSGSGQTESEAYDNATEEMKQLQTVLITGSLPFKLEIVKLDTISPTLGREFTTAILLAGMSALLAVTIIISIRYKRIKSSLALLLTSISEVFIILGVASLINWNLDLPSMAGILASIGTGIDSQIILLDESLRSKSMNVIQRLKRAFTIILGAYLTAVVALIPLFWAVAGLFQGFAITTIIGITIGVLITRPAFSDMLMKTENKKQ